MSLTLTMSASQRVCAALATLQVNMFEIGKAFLYLQIPVFVSPVVSLRTYWTLTIRHPHGSKVGRNMSEMGKICQVFQGFAKPTCSLLPAGGHL
jgi:hypothetical protein